MSRFLFIGAIVVGAGCSGSVVKDDRPPFRIDPEQAFRLELGRGSGKHGLDTIRVGQDGSVVLHRQKRGESKRLWETATLQLQAGQLAEVLNAVETNDLMKLHRSYHADVHDGTQWALWIKQGEQEKSVYFNNSFPRQITEFAKQLDGILSAAGLEKPVWTTVPEQESRQHEKELWSSIKR